MTKIFLLSLKIAFIPLIKLNSKMSLRNKIYVYPYTNFTKLIFS